jgi:tRNA uridine 5-carboxymethylaminomethyl modification enzyme
MIDDLVSRGVSEPYRMFTSRAEYRLHLRADNADQRLTPFGLALGCVSGDRARIFERKMSLLKDGRAALAAYSWTPRVVEDVGIKIRQDGVRRNGHDILAFPDVSFEDLVRLDPSLERYDADTRRQLEREALYARYLDRQREDVAALKRDEAQRIPEDFDYHSLPGLSSELRGKLSNAAPSTLAQAARVEGMTPAALTLLLARLRQRSRTATG